MRKIILTLFVAILILVVYTLNQHALSYTSGAPTGSTNAPGETTCSSNGGSCHALFPVTNIGGTTLMAMEDISNGYIPGTTYNIMPFINEDGSPKIGFQTVALLASGQAAGSVTITNSKTQMNTIAGKEYVAHSASGTTGILLMDWMYEWTAPSAGSGTVTIYGAFLASNNDMTASGDSIYTDSLVIPEKTTGIIDGENSGFTLHVFPAVTTDGVTLNYYSESNFPGEILVFDLKGNVLLKRNFDFFSGENSLVIDFKKISGGIRLIFLNSENFVVVKKVVRM